MTVMRRVVSRDVGERTATETLECGHVNTLYRQVRGNRVAWCSQRGAATNLSATSRECPACADEEREREAARTRGWRP